MNIIIAGGRDFNNYPLLKKKMDEILKDISNVNIVSGMAKGADTLGINYAKEKNLKVIEMPADWDKFGKSAGYRRNEDMARISDACVCFWDGKSRGTKHMIDLAKKYELQLRVIKY